MSGKQNFIAAIEYALAEGCVLELSNEAKEYFESLKKSANIGLTENGTKILAWLNDNYVDGKYFSAKEIAEGLFTSSRAVSGAMRKLISEEYVLKEGKDPVRYIINTEKENNI